MKNNTLFFGCLLVSILFTACFVYQTPKVYKKNFKPGFNANLRFSGFYDEDTSKKYITDAYYFYRDGTFISINKGRILQSTIEAELIENGGFGQECIYTISNDTMRTEKWQANGFAPIMIKYRINQTILIRPDSLIVISATHSGETMVFNPPFVMTFRPTQIKPDSQPNFIMKKKSWNWRR